MIIFGRRILTPSHAAHGQKKAQISPEEPSIKPWSLFGADGYMATRCIGLYEKRWWVQPINQKDRSNSKMNAHRLWRVVIGLRTKVVRLLLGVCG